MSDLVEEVSVTLKGGKGYEVPWLVFKGTVAETRKALIEAFGWDANVEGTLSQLASSASAEFQRTIEREGKVGPVTYKGTEPAAPEGENKDTKPADVGDSWAGANPAKEEEPAEDPLIAAIKSAGSLETIQRLYVKHKADFDSRDDLKEAVIARRKELGA